MLLRLVSGLKIYFVPPRTTVLTTKNASMSEVLPPVFIYINGYPGVGKLTIARELLTLLPQPARLVDNHLLIDPVAALLERGSDEYQALRKAVRLTILLAIARSSELKSTNIVFTDSQSSSPLGSIVAKDYFDSAKNRGCPFFSIRLVCAEEEHFRRAVDGRRQNDGTTKLTDINILRQIRMQEDIFSFGGPLELTLDVSRMSPDVAAREIVEFVKQNLTSESEGSDT
jgi:hypothetical protein